MAKVTINQQDSTPRINETGELVYAESSNTLFLKTIRNGVRQIGITNEQDPLFTAWLAGPPNISTFVNDVPYLSTVAVDGVTITGDGTPGNPLIASGSLVTPAALTKTDDTNVTLTLGGSPNTSLLAATSLTLGWTGTLADSRIASATTWNSKQNAITTGTTAQYFRGDLSLATFPTIPTVGTWGGLNYPTWSSGTPFVKMTAAGTFALDTNTYLTGITSLDVTTALGYTPYNATNPSGYITSSSLTGYLQNNVGISGGTTLIGGTSSGNNLTLSSTSNATKGKILFGTSAYDEVNNRLGIGLTSPTQRLEVSGSILATSIGLIHTIAGAGSGIWFGANSMSPTTGNYAFLQSSSYTILNTPTGSKFYFGINNSYVANMSTVGVWFGGGTTNASAKIHIAAGTASAGTAPLKLTSGTNLTTPENGVFEYNNTFYLTNSDTTRRHVVLAPNTNKVTAAAPYTNDGYIVLNIGGIDFKILTTL